MSPNRSPHDPSNPTPPSAQGRTEAATQTFTVEEVAAYAESQHPDPPTSADPRGRDDPQTDLLADPLADPLPEQVADPVAGPPASPPQPSSAQPVQLPGVPSPRQQAAAPGTGPGTAPGVEPAGPHPARSPVQPPVGAKHTSETRRVISASDFLDRRAYSTEDGPATWGWRGAVRRWSGGVVEPRRGPAELAHEQDRATIQQDFDGPRTIAFINPKGGAAKTTGVLAAGYTFGTVRGGGVVAWDNNETRGTLGIRGIRGSHRNTTRELLGNLDRFSDVQESRIGDLGAFVRSQGNAHFDVLASDERADFAGMIRTQDFVAVHNLLERFYRVILIDTGNNMRAENWLSAAEAADLLVVTSTVREDTAYSGLWMLDALQDAGYPNLKFKTVTVLSDPSEQVDPNLARDLVDIYGQRTRGVYRVPYDPVLVPGSVVPYSQLSRDTRRSWLKACAAMAAAL
jgi:MinD-like ATPase involved in chromosome partitioning or flagellar assembly